MPTLASWLARTPRPLYGVLRRLRTALYYLAGPFDYLLRATSGRRHAPPLWLRRHIGPLAGFERATGEIAAMLAAYTLLNERSRVLDVGCGCGVMVPDLQRMLGPDGRYLGFDVHEPSIAWCRRQYAADRRFTFELARVHTPYSPQFTTQPTDFRFPVDDAWADFILVKSVFTHLFEAESRHYLAEIHRTLSPDGQALISAFLVRERAAGRAPMYEFPLGDGPVHWMVGARPTAGVAYDEAHFAQMVTDAGLEIRRLIPGYWQGSGIAPNVQDQLIVSRAKTSVASPHATPVQSRSSTRLGAPPAPVRR
jgi:SAM-dependent methyltransferase